MTKHIETLDTREVCTIQLWPGGRSVTYRGDEYAAELRDGDAWRPATVDEQRELRIEIRARRYGDRDILGCDSALVDELIKAASGGDFRGDLGDAFNYDEIRNIYADPSDWDMATCRAYLEDNSLDTPDLNPWDTDRETIVELLTDAGIECRDDETDDTLRDALIANMDDETIGGIDTWRDACREHAQDNPREPYEWWRVSSWLCDKLHDIGEVTIDNGYGHWWGRTCTGQAWIMDGTLQAIAARFEE